MVGGAVAGVLVVLWALVTVVRKGKLDQRTAGGSQTRDTLTEFASKSLGLESVTDILIFAREAGLVIFGCERVVAFERSGEDAAWAASIPGQSSLGELPAHLRGLFAWVKHNNAIAVEADLGGARFGAMRAPLREVMTKYDCDVLLPLVQNNEVVAMLGLKLGRKPTVVDRDLMRLFRLQATAACVNVRLHREAAHMVSLAKEVDLASAVQLALVPESMEGEISEVTWAGHFQAVDEAASDFWGAYTLPNGRVCIVIGDAIGAGLAGSMVSAVVKSCCDAIFDAKPTRLDPSSLLGALNRALYRSQNPSHTSCFVAMIDPAEKKLLYANAGHPIPYHLRMDGPRVKLGVLTGGGPLLGDSHEAEYPVTEVALEGGDSGDRFVFFTDGLVKTENADKQALGERQLQRLLQKQGRATPSEIRGELIALIDEHRGQARLVDDLAFVIVKA